MIRRSNTTVSLAAFALLSSACGDDPAPIDTPPDATAAPEVDAGIDAAAPAIPTRPDDLSACSSNQGESAGTIEIDSDDPEDSRLTEVSGITASRSQPMLWVHDDSGNEPNVYALSLGNDNIDDGTPLAVYELPGVAIRDWEDIAMGPGPADGVDYVYLGDIGDKNRDGLGSDIVVYRFPEPTVQIPTVEEGGEVPDATEATVPSFDAIRANYPEGLVENADALFVDPGSGSSPDVYVITSGNGITTPNRVFRLSTATPTEIVTMELVTEVYGGAAGDPEVTGADMSPDGRRIIMRSLAAANLWTVGANQSVAEALAGRPCDALIPPGDASSQEGGAIGFSNNSSGYFTTIEGDPAPFWRVSL